MAKVKIQGHASGTGILTITAPNTSTDRTITLPDSTGTILDENSSLPAGNLTGNLPAISGANLTGVAPTKSVVEALGISASSITGALPAISGASLTALNASNLGSGTVSTARLGTGTADAGSFLRGDGAWEAVVGIPSGVIVMWSGAINAIPTGWVICDGTNSTPNLTDRFVIHADADSGGTRDVNDTGGSHTATPLGSVGTSGAHTLSTSQMPSHTHTHTYANQYRIDVENCGYPNVSCLDGTGTTNTGSTGSGGSHTHTGGTFAGSSTTVTPKFYALAYIMKT